MGKRELVAALFEDARAGRIDRRAFVQRAAGLGLGLTMATALSNSLVFTAAAQDSDPAALTSRPAFGTDQQERGAGGELRLLQWQAVTSFSTHNSTGSKDVLGGSLVYEPLLNYLPDSSLLPNLVKDVPSIENGLLAEDLTSVTYNLVEGIFWNDGTPFTAHDVVATWAWIVNPESAATTSGSYASIANVEAIDDLTVTITFAQSNLAWFLPFTGTNVGVVYPKHILELGEEGRVTLRTAPVGTGPYKVESFVEGDNAQLVINDYYREPNKPFFATVNLKGNVTSDAAARGVIQLGEWDFAWNPQVSPDVLRDYENGGAGTGRFSPSPSFEGVQLNFSDPNAEVNGQRSEKNTPHPFLTDPTVRRALNLASDREIISSEFYVGAPDEPAARNVVNGIASLESPNTGYLFDVEAAKATLEEAGWVLNGDVREKDGVRLELQLVTTVNSVRQDTQAVLKSNWEEIGFEVELVEIDSAIFFDSSPGNEQGWYLFYRDTQMLTIGPTSPFPFDFLGYWYAGPDGSNIAQQENDWSGSNIQRFRNEEYDQLYESL
ncbi:MAG: peptide ABC transporter substrate-binding protein, partial [Verrucomicrobiae bacterium]|nr:peptide ABC transporter substrate-binding protein [Verrucomicrobiae bacterium]